MSRMSYDAAAACFNHRLSGRPTDLMNDSRWRQQPPVHAFLSNGRRRGILLALCLSCMAHVAEAQNGTLARREAPPGEEYVLEGFFGYWFPKADVVLSSDALDVPGTRVDLR